MGAKQSEQMTAALELIIKDGKSAALAAAMTGLTKGAISKNREYRKFMEAKKNAKAS